MAYSLYQLLWFFLLYSFLGWRRCGSRRPAQACFHQHRLPQPAAVSHLRRSGGALLHFPAGALRESVLSLPGGHGALRLPHLCDRLPAGADLPFGDGGISPATVSSSRAISPCRCWRSGVLWRCCASASAIPSFRRVAGSDAPLGRAAHSAGRLSAHRAGFPALSGLCSPAPVPAQAPGRTGRGFPQYLLNFGNAITGRIQRRVMHAYPNLETQDISGTRQEKRTVPKSLPRAAVFINSCGSSSLPPFWEI